MRSSCRVLTGIARREIEVVTNGIDVGEVLGLAPTGLRLAQRLGLFDADPLLLLPVRRHAAQAGRGGDRRDIACSVAAAAPPCSS